jgi:glucose/arabinose dehydrogenase
MEQRGQIRIVESGLLQATPFLSIDPNRISSLSSGYDERGLLGFAFDPDFANASAQGYRRIFTYTSERTTTGTPDYVTPAGGTTNHHSVIASWRVDAANPNLIDPNSRQELLRFGQPQSNHNGGPMVFGPDGFLYIGSGDGGSANDVATGHNPTIGNGQDTQTVLGKVLRIDVNGTNSINGRYGIPASNPFAISGGLKEIYAYGFRNPFGLSFSGNTLVVADVGQNNVEEVNIVTNGGNYGWFYKEGTFRFNSADGTVSTDLSGLPPNLIDPVLQYDHTQGISVIGGFVYEGDLMPELRGKYIFGDFSSSFSTPNGRLFYGDLATGEIQRFLLGASNDPLGLFIKGFGKDDAGEIYVLGSTSLGPPTIASGVTPGVVYRLIPEPSTALLLCLSAGLTLAARRNRNRPTVG